MAFQSPSSLDLTLSLPTALPPYQVTDTEGAEDKSPLTAELTSSEAKQAEQLVGLSIMHPPPQGQELQRTTGEPRKLAA